MRRSKNNTHFGYTAIVLTIVYLVGMIVFVKASLTASLEARVAKDQARWARTALESYKRTMGHVDTAYNCKENALTTYLRERQ